MYVHRFWPRVAEVEKEEVFGRLEKVVGVMDVLKGLRAGRADVKERLVRERVSWPRELLCRRVVVRFLCARGTTLGAVEIAVEANARVLC